MEGILPEQFEQGLAYLSHKLVYAFRQRLGQICRAHGYAMTPEELGILLVLDREGGATQTCLSEVIDKDKASVTRLLNKLVELGYVERVNDASDRRIIRTYLTAAGREVYQTIRPALQAMSQKVFADVSEADFIAARRVLTVAITHLKTEE